METRWKAYFLEWSDGYGGYGCEEDAFEAGFQSGKKVGQFLARANITKESVKTSANNGYKAIAQIADEIDKYLKELDDDENCRVADTVMKNWSRQLHVL